jgi:hypothetical protein
MYPFTKTCKDCKYRLEPASAATEEFPMTLGSVFKQPFIKGMLLAYASVLIGLLIDRLTGW